VFRRTYGTPRIALLCQDYFIWTKRRRRRSLGNRRIVCASRSSLNFSNVSPPRNTCIVRDLHRNLDLFPPLNPKFRPRFEAQTQTRTASLTFSTPSQYTHLFVPPFRTTQFSHRISTSMTLLSFATCPTSCTGQTRRMQNSSSFPTRSTFYGFCSTQSSGRR
jgi:hypothetical protein